MITDAIAAARPDAGVWSKSAGRETLRVPYFPVPTVGIRAMDPNSGAIVPVPFPDAIVQIAATLVQIYHPTIRIGPARHTMCTGCVSPLACTCVTGAVTGHSTAIGSSCSGTHLGQGLGGASSGEGENYKDR